ncbi:MAG: hypothetical protein CBHOC_5098 [uncultured Caballeronia sp.]|nr:MAG: hypothetical protein CBHOC_5098 [uncultured Caballeronia sp.]
MAIDGVRWVNDRVTDVRWGSFDPATNDWAAPTTIVQVQQVVDALKSGKEVRTLFKLGGRPFLGPKVSALPYANGHVGIEARVQDGQPDREIARRPAFGLSLAKGAALMHAPGSRRTSIESRAGAALRDRIHAAHPRMRGA